VKILYVVTRAEIGGAQVHVLDLVRGFRSEFEVVLAAGEEGFLIEKGREAGASVHVLKGLKQPIAPLNDFAGLRELVRLIRSEKPDLVHAHTSKAGILGRFAARICSIPAIYTAHTWCFAEGTSWKWKAFGLPCERLAARFHPRIITVSEANAELARTYRVGRPEYSVSIHNGIPETAMRANPGECCDPVLVMAARFAPQKNHRLLLRALAGIREGWRLVLLGDGPMRPEMEREAEELGISGRVDFLGARTDVAAVLAAAHIFVLATNWEGFPLTVLEAMRAGLPVVASDVGGIREAVGHLETGYLTAAGDEQGLRTCLLKLIRDPGQRARMGVAGRQRYQADFSVETMLKKTREVYRAVSGSVYSDAPLTDKTSFSPESIGRT